MDGTKVIEKFYKGTKAVLITLICLPFYPLVLLMALFFGWVLQENNNIPEDLEDQKKDADENKEDEGS